MHLTKIHRLNIGMALIGALVALMTMASQSRAAIAACGPTTRLHLELLIDDSKSMATNDPTNLRGAAARLVVDSLPDKDIVGAIAFEGTSRALFEPITLDAGNREPLRAALTNGLTALGTKTLYKPAIEQAIVEFGKTTATRKAAILLSDGQPGDPNQGAHTLLKDTPVFTVGLGAGPHTSLQKIATETGGKFAQAATPADLVTEFSNIVNSLRCADVGGDFSDTLSAGQSVTHTVPVAKGTAELAFRSSWVLGRVKVTFTTPGGLVYSTAGTFPKGVFVAEDSTFASFSARRPRAGDWKITITALEGTTSAKINTQVSQTLTKLAITGVKATPRAFLTSTKLRFKSSIPTVVRVIVTPLGKSKAVRAYSVSARAGINRITFNRTRKGRTLADGVYTIKIQGKQGTKKVISRVRVTAL